MGDLKSRRWNTSPQATRAAFAVANASLGDDPLAVGLAQT
jgi:hypothetical protein